ncbi:MAG: hypothetical protein WC323_01460 [Patescibacteria group bacterium]|jgi:hypothetical protein
MFLTVHSTVAIAITQGVTNPMGAFFVGLLSHYILDLIPHGDEKFKNFTISQMGRAAIIDHLGVLLILISLFFLKPGFFISINIIFALIGAMLPDWLIAIYELSAKSQNFIIKKIHNLLTPLQNFHIKIHRIIKYNISFSSGIILQIILLITFWRLI